MTSHKVLVTGATGIQGGAVARLLLKANWTVHAFVRNPSADAAKALASQGAVIFEGDWDNIDALQAAAKDCYGLFLNVYPSFQNDGAELRHARNILTCAKNAGVKHVIYSSAIGVDRYETLVKPAPGSFTEQYFQSKRAIEEEVQKGGWETETIFRGTNFHTNFLLPAVNFMFPELVAEGKLISAYTPETKLLMIDPEDIGKFVVAAFLDPKKYGGKGINLASQALKVQTVADLMGKVAGKKVEVIFHSEAEIQAQKHTHPVIGSQDAVKNMHTWMDVSETEEWGLPLRTFEEFLESHKEIVQNTVGGETQPTETK